LQPSVNPFLAKVSTDGQGLAFAAEVDVMDVQACRDGDGIL